MVRDEVDLIDLLERFEKAYEQDSSEYNRAVIETLRYVVGENDDEPELDEY